MTAPAPAQIGLASHADCGHATSGRNKWGQNKPGAGYTRVDDPVDGSDRKVARAASTSGTIAALELTLDTPILGHYMVIAECNWSAAAGFLAGGGGQSIFLQLRVNDGAGGTSSLSLDHNSTGGGYRGRLVNPLTGGGNVTWAGNVNLTAGVWGCLAIAVDTVNGTIKVWRANNKRLKDAVAGDFAEVVSTGAFTAGSDRGALKTVRFPGNTDSAGGNSTQTHGRFLSWGTWDTDFATTFAGVKHKVYGTAWGVCYPSATAGKLDARLRATYDKDLWGTAGSGTVHCGFEIATDAGFSNIIQTVSGSVLFESQGWTRTTTITGLDENSVYYARAVWTRDPSGTPDILYGEPAILRTPSVSTPTTIRYGLSTCWATGENHCETAMVLCAQNHPTLHAYIQVGDKGYLDNAMASDSVSTPDAASVRRELLVCQTASPWEWLCTLMATEEQQDDHECPPVLKAISAIPTGSGNINVTVTGHGRLVGDVVSFSNTNSTPAINNNFRILAVPDADTITVRSSATITGAGTSGTVRFPGVGWNGRGEGQIDPLSWEAMQAAWVPLSAYSVPAIGSTWRGTTPSHNAPGGAEAFDDADVTWYATATARTLRISLNCRVGRSPVDQEMLGPTQLADALRWINARGNREVLIIISGVMMTSIDRNKRQAIWDSAGQISRSDLWGGDRQNVIVDYMDERDTLFAAARAAGWRQIIVFEGDGHRMLITRSHGLLGDGINSGEAADAVAFAAVMTSNRHVVTHLEIPDHPDYNSASPVTAAQWVENPDTWEVLTAGDVANSARSYSVLTIDEAARTYNIEIFDGRTGASLGDYDGTWTPPPGGIRSSRLRNRDITVRAT